MVVIVINQGIQSVLVRNEKLKKYQIEVLLAKVILINQIKINEHQNQNQIQIQNHQIQNQLNIVHIVVAVYMKDFIEQEVV